MSFSSLTGGRGMRLNALHRGWLEMCRKPVGGGKRPANPMTLFRLRARGAERQRI
jgi:hypothetical protein